MYIQLYFIKFHFQDIYFQLTQYAILSAARDYISQIKSEDEAERKKMEELERQNKKLQKKCKTIYLYY